MKEIKSSKKIFGVVILQYVLVVGLGLLLVNNLFNILAPKSFHSALDKRVDQFFDKTEEILGVKTSPKMCKITAKKKNVYQRSIERLCKISVNLNKNIKEKVVKKNEGKKPEVKVPTSDPQLNSVQVEAWIYPGPPSCSAISELKVRNIHTVKVEYLSLKDSGVINVLTENNAGCNGYSTSNVALLKAYSKELYVTISGGYEGLNTLVRSSTLQNNFVGQVVKFVNDNGLTGVDIDFEEFSRWSSSDYEGYKKVMSQLGIQLHKYGKKLQLDLPAISDANSQSHFKLKYEDFNSLPIDQYTIMAYDYQYDYGASTSIQPTSWLSSVIDWAKMKFQDDAKISIGVPAYGYKGVCNSYNISILTYDQIKSLSGFSSAIRDNASYEMKWRVGNTCYNYNDSTSLDSKLKVIKSKGISQVSVWHLGGNQWFSK